MISATSQTRTATVILCGVRRLQTGARLGAYVLERRLGASATAEVWRARLEGPDGFRRTVVLKRALPELSRDEKFRASLAAEARATAALDHPNIARTFTLEELD